ncbi:MAG TPA: Crp/Fnr family transcriptional regulator [Actinophytocola sp.]|uniref:Crp/Fnr family transcriptional regulator n=1 Tax=Actinophytocola sp. TaxID=1872138 RepID=UPI002DB5831F|nr:Crp/Fnr family transcriptional regulator [Actinophytocola sp.]HEU5470529.1 Crp/Fnr family transcriptional regulator [Actinophytocola sp.]
MTLPEEEGRAWYRLTAAEQAALREAGYTQEWRPGEVIIRQGAPPGGMCVILSGWVKISVTNERGDNAPIAARGPGEIIGELGAISGRPRNSTIHAIGTVHALVIPQERLRTVLARQPRIAQELLSVAAIRLTQSDLLRLEAGGPAFPQRLAATLLELAHQCAPHTLNPIPDTTPIDLPFTQDELAAFARVSRSTLVRGLDELRSLGILETARRRVRIVSLARLRDLATGRT